MSVPDSLNQPWKPEPSSILADHRLIRKIGHGSYGEVWLVKNIPLGTFRALKIVWFFSSAGEKHCTREYEAIKRYEPISRRHEGLVPILHVGFVEGGFYYVMEVADCVTRGRNFHEDFYKPRTLAAKNQRLPIAECVDLGIKLGRALDFLHSEGFLHRDIKPANVVFIGGQPRLADPGLITTLDEANSFVGTVGFVAPEGPVSTQADIFSFGKLLYEIATGKDRHCYPELPDDITEDDALFMEFNQVLLQACENNPRVRYRNVSALLQDLGRLEAGKSLRKLQQTRKQLRAALASLAALLIIGSVAFAAFVRVKARQIQAAEELQRRLGTQIAKGEERLERGDFLGALPLFLDAAREDPANKRIHSLRVGSVTHFSAKLLHSWKTGGYPILGPSGLSVSVRKDATIDWFSSTNGKLLLSIPRKASVVAIDPADSRIAVCTGSSCTLFDRAGTAEELHSNREIKAVAFSSAGTLAIGTDLDIEMRPGDKRVPLDVNFQLEKLVFSPSGRLLLFMDFTGRTGLINVQTGDLLKTSPLHSTAVCDGAFSSDDLFLVTGGFDRMAQKWDIPNGTFTGSPLNHKNAVMGVAISPDGNHVVTAGLDQTVRFWNFRTMSAAPANPVIYCQDRVTQVRFLGNQQVIYKTSEGVIESWLLVSPTPQISETQRVEIPSKIQPGHSGATVRGHAILFASGDKKAEVRLGRHIECVAFHPANSLLAVGTRLDNFVKESVRLYTTAGAFTGKEFHHGDGITFVLFNRSGTRLVTCSEDNSAAIWDLTTSRQIGDSLRHGHQVRWAAFNSNEEMLATAAWDGSVIIWDAATGDQVTPIINFNDVLEYVTFSNDDTEIFVSTLKRGYTYRLPYSDLSNLGKAPAGFSRL